MSVPGTGIYRYRAVDGSTRSTPMGSHAPIIYRPGYRSLSPFPLTYQNVTMALYRSVPAAMYTSRPLE